MAPLQHPTHPDVQIEQRYHQDHIERRSKEESRYGQLHIQPEQESKDQRKEYIHQQLEYFFKSHRLPLFPLFTVLPL